MELRIKGFFVPPTFLENAIANRSEKASVLDQDAHSFLDPTSSHSHHITPAHHVDTLSNNSPLDLLREDESEEACLEYLYDAYPSIPMDPTLQRCSKPSFSLIRQEEEPQCHTIFVHQSHRQVYWQTQPFKPPLYLSFAQRILHALFCTMHSHDPYLFVAFASTGKFYHLKNKESTLAHLPFVPLQVKALSTKGLLFQPAVPTHLKSDPKYHGLYYLEHPLQQLLPIALHHGSSIPLGSESRGQGMTSRSGSEPTLFQLSPEESLLFTFQEMVVIGSPSQLAFYHLLSIRHPPTAEADSPSHATPARLQRQRRASHGTSRSFSSFDSPLGGASSPWPPASLASTPPKEGSSDPNVSSTTVPLLLAQKQLLLMGHVAIPQSHHCPSLHPCSDIRSKHPQLAVHFLGASSPSSGSSLYIITWDTKARKITILQAFDAIAQVLSIQWRGTHPCLLIHKADQSLYLWIGFLPLIPVTSKIHALTHLAWTHPVSSHIFVATAESHHQLQQVALELPRWKPQRLTQLLDVLAYALPEAEYWSLAFQPPSGLPLPDLLLRSSQPSSVLAVLSLLYQEWKLNLLCTSHLAQLAEVLVALSAKLGWTHYSDYFAMQFPEFGMPLFLPLPHANPTEAFLDPPHWLNYLQDMLDASDQGVVYPSLASIQSHFGIDNAFTQHLDMHQLLPRTTIACQFVERITQTPDLSHADLQAVARFLFEKIPLKASLDSWPWCWQVLFLGFLEQAKNTVFQAPSIDPKFANYLERPELLRTRSHSLHAYSLNASNTDSKKNALVQPLTSSVRPGSASGSSASMTSLTRSMRFPSKDALFLEALSLLALPTTPVYLEHAVFSGNEDAVRPEVVIAEKQRAIEWYASHVFASHLGRAAFHLDSVSLPSPPQHWTLPSMPPFSVVFPSDTHVHGSSTPMAFDPPSHSCDWPDFHFGVASALGYRREDAPWKEEWLWLHRPKLLTPTFGGLLMGLGLAGHLKSMTPLLSIYLLRQSHVFVDIGYLLGLSVANRGSLDEILLRLLTLHPTDIGYTDPNDHPLRQMTNMVCIGLLRSGHSNPTIASIFMRQLHTSSDDSFSWCAAVGLAFMEAGQCPTALLPSFSRLLTTHTNTLVPIYIALGMLFFKSHRQEVEPLLLPPSSAKALKTYAPDVLFARCVAYHLVHWDHIRPECSFVDRFRVQGIPLYLEQHLVAATCYVIALKFAGSANETALATLMHFLEWMAQFTKDVALLYEEKIMKKSSKEGVDVLCMCCAILMAGTGDARVFSKLYPMQQRLGPNVSYASHCPIHLALGFLFCGEQRYSFTTTRPEQVLGLLCATWPRYPSTFHEQAGHFQPLRHFWMLAVKPKFYFCETLEGHPIKLPAFIRCPTPQWVRLPCLIPDAEQMCSLVLNDALVYPLAFHAPHIPTKLVVQRRSDVYLPSFLRCLNRRPVRLSVTFLETLRSLMLFCARFPFFKDHWSTALHTLLDHIELTLMAHPPPPPTRLLETWAACSPDLRVQYACFWFWFECALVRQCHAQSQTDRLQSVVPMNKQEVAMLHKLMLFGMPEPK